MNRPPLAVDTPAPAWLVAAAIAAAMLPTLLAYNVAPSPTFLNQALALAAWGLFMVVVAGGLRWRRGPGPLLLALAVVAVAAVWSWGPGALPGSLALSAIGLLFAAALLAMAAAGTRAHGDGGVAVFSAFALGWVVAGVCNVAVALVQVFAPGWADGSWIAVSGIAGRAVGNLRQPNHLSTVLLLAAVALVALIELQRLPATRWRMGRMMLAAALMAALVGGVVLTASRTGLLSVLLLATWGLVDRRLARGTRGLLLAAPLFYAAAWAAMAGWAAVGEHSFGGSQRLAETDISGSRFAIWANTLALIAHEPLAGVGFGQFNFAWSLTPFPGRPTAFFDHTHNLPLQLAVELGLPLAAGVCGLLAWALLRAARHAWARADAAESLCGRVAVAMVAMLGLHSLLEYPLWYAYFLLPAAWAWGWALGAPRRADTAAAGMLPQGSAAIAGLVLAVAAALTVGDYRRVALIFSAPAGSPPLAERIATGRQSWFFGHHADYAAVTSGQLRGADAAPAFARARHYLLDTRLTMAWARWYEGQGRSDEARHLAARLREFHRPESTAWFDGCPEPRPALPNLVLMVPDAFACEAPSRVVPWREFLAPPSR
jgi:O-antigen ligase